MAKTTLGLLLIAATAVACQRETPKAPEAPAADPTRMSAAVVEPYLKINTALAADSLDGVTMNAGEIAAAAGTLGPAAIRIGTTAAQLASASDVADARVKLAGLSEAIDAYMSAQHLTPPEGVRVAFCPMVMKPWMQKDGPLRNPYYGSQMLTCGSFRN